MTPLPEFAIRIATTDDIPALIALIEQSVRVLQVNDYSPAQIESSLGTTFGIDRQLLADRTYFVATPINDPAHIAGCGGWSFRRTLFGSDALANRDDTPLDPAQDFAKIRAIFIDPAWSRQGLGSLILAHSEQAAQTAGFHRFELASTLTGVPLYTLRGYTERERICIPLPDCEPREIVVMQKILPIL